MSEEGKGATILDILDRLSPEDRAVVESHFTYANYREGQPIISHQEQDRDVFFVLEGRLRATLYSDTGRAVDYSDAAPGDVVGELAAIDGAPRSATVEALTPVRLARLSEAAFRELIETHPAFTSALLQHLTAQIRKLTERVFELTTLPMRHRLLRELLRLGTAAGIERGQAVIRPAPTHFELASRIGAHREAVSREMSALHKAGLVDKRGGVLVLREPETLRGLMRAEE